MSRNTVWIFILFRALCLTYLWPFKQCLEGLFLCRILTLLRPPKQQAFGELLGLLAQRLGPCRLDIHGHLQSYPLLSLLRLRIVFYINSADLVCSVIKIQYKDVWLLLVCTLCTVWIVRFRLRRFAFVRSTRLISIFAQTLVDLRFITHESNWHYSLL
jgi:hypothetical protein